ncbi:unnamed protein product, partial [marine sediment metagenome]
WFFENAGLLIEQIFSPIRYIFTFTKSFFVSAFAPPSTPESIWIVSDGVLGIFNNIPYFNVMVSALALGLMLIFGFAILKTFLKT